MHTHTHAFPGIISTSHRFEVPLDHSQPDGIKINVFGRELVAADQTDKALPYLVYIQGGPGFESPRPARKTGWIGRALDEFRVLLVDQRGTGKSAPVCARTLAVFDTPQAQADYLSLFRADAIVQDLEFIRKTHLGPEVKWTILGQSFGGFCAVNYLSVAPEGLEAALFTGGLPPVTGHADRVYESTYPRVLTRNERYFARYPEDVDQIARIADYLRAHDVVLPTGTALTVRVFQQLGIRLGAHDGAERVHYLLEDAFIVGPEGPELSLRFLRQVENQLSFDTNPIYALLHEAIYCQKEASDWSAHRVGQRYGIIDADPVRFTGEMVYPWMFEDYLHLRPLAEAAELLAQKADWPDLYDLEALAKNTVPCAAMIYDEDMYVERALSVETANAIGQMRTWVSNEFEHNGIGVDGARILGYLLDMTRGMR
jgi:pimeloyl-ACP methyl ester carboxylesterase